MCQPTVQATVFNIQSYSIHDGPGIRTTVFLKGCPLSCLWCANPESNETFPQLMTYPNKCAGCGACIAACPKQGITPMMEDGRLLTDTQYDACIACGACVDVCPANAREISGKSMTVEDVLAEVEKDRMFFSGSGGGMTVSGGECLMHPQFTADLLRTAKERGIHTAVESCCFAAQSVIDAVFPYVDLCLLDIKHMDPKKHAEYTGVPNAPILDNIRHIYHDLGKDIIIRIPVIPGCNDSDEDILAIAGFVKHELSEQVPVHLLPYHSLGESKSASLGRPIRFSAKAPDHTQMQHLKSLVESIGLTCQIGG